MKRICELKEVNEEVMGRFLLKEIQLIITEETFSRENRKEKKAIRGGQELNWFFPPAMPTAGLSSQPRNQTWATPGTLATAVTVLSPLTAKPPGNFWLFNFKQRSQGLGMQGYF